MDTHRIESLHQAASEHYLRGEFKEALQAWKAVLRIDPSHEQALEGIRLARLNAEGEAISGPEAIGASNYPAEQAVDTSDLAAITVGMHTVPLAQLERAIDRHDPAEPAPTPAPAAAASEAIEIPEIELPEFLDLGTRGAKASPDTARADTSAVGLAPFNSPRQLTPVLGDGAAEGEETTAPISATPAAASPTGGQEDAATRELRGRVRDLLHEAEEALAKKDFDRAKSTLSRVFILDEGNEIARGLEEKVQEALGASNLKIEEWINAGVQDFENGRPEESRDYFLKVLERIPNHGEALAYLDKIDAALTAREAAAEPASPRANQERPQDRLFDGAAAEGVALAAGKGSPTTVPINADLMLDQSRARARGATARATEAPTGAPVDAGRRLPLARVAVGVLVIAVLGTGGWFGVSWFLGRASVVKAPAPKPSVQTTTARVSRPRVEPQNPEPVRPPAPAPKLTGSVPDLLARARAAFERQDYAGAVLAYNAVLSLEADNDEAKSGLARAGEAYKAQKAEHEQMEKVRDAFREEDYTTALKLLYRMPEKGNLVAMDRYKVNGWYNLGVNALKIGDCRTAASHFDEAMAIRPSDPELKRVKALSQRYAGDLADPSIKDEVSKLTLRGMDD
jgi:tetratricopeptide (TPR) repeat protein